MSEVSAHSRVHTFQSIFELIEYGKYNEALASLNEASLGTTERDALRQLVLVETADANIASDAARNLLQRKLKDHERVLCLLVVGRAGSILGHTDESCAALRQAIAVARSCNDLVLVARAQARLTKTLLRYVGTEPAIADAPNLRRCAHAAGDRRAVADFHCVMAEIEMKRRNYGSAQKHLALAEDLCDGTSDLLMQAQVGRLKANFALWASEPGNALKAILPTLKILENTGSKYALIASLSTLAEHHLMVGAFAEAEGVLKQIGELNRAPEATLNNLDSLMVAALGQDQLNKAEALQRSIDALGSFPPTLYSWLWHVTTRACLLIKAGRCREAHSLLTQFHELAVKTYDERLIARYLLLESESLISEKAPVHAASSLVTAVGSMPHPTLEDFVEINRIAAKLPSAMSRSFEARAARIRSIGFSDVAREYPLDASNPGVGTPVEVVHAVASLVNSRGQAELLAHETAALLHTSGVAERVSILEAISTQARSDREAAFDAVDIPVRDHTGLRYVVRARPKRQVDAWLSIMAIQGLVRATTELAEARFYERVEPTTWPETQAESHVGMIVAAASMNELLNVTRRVATSNALVLFTGETGTGKELLARALHDASPRRGKPFIPFNCTAVARDMLDSQLFGYRRGAFTGAVEHFPGVIRAAAGGTLFLDEIGELPLEVQPKLLRFLESGEVHPLGETQPTVVDVRVVAATNANLEQLVEQGRFREDLFYRLNVVRLQVPALRERREEIPLLAQHYIDLYAREARKAGIRIAEETMEYLVLYRWPGNVRQLANEMRRLVALAESGAVLMPEHLSREIAASRRTVPASQRDLAPTEFVVRVDQPMSAAIDHLERSMIQYAINLCEGRQEDAARMLGLSRKGLYLKRARLKIGTHSRTRKQNDPND
jgi:DNA-binding NtrC family response regulator/tetratricopeptide (TPR) repeat protein